MTTDWEDELRAHRRKTNDRTGGLRHEVAVPARIEGSRGGAIEAEILDVSSTGMYLRHAMFVAKVEQDALPVGSPVTVTFAPDHANAPHDTVQIAAEIARRGPHGIGLHFHELGRDQRRALRTLAALAVAARTRAESADPRHDRSAPTVDSRAVMGACLKVLERRLPNIIWTLRTELVKELQLKAAGTPDEAAEATAEAEHIIDKSTAIARTIERRVMQTLAEIGNLDFTQEIVLSQLKRPRAGARTASSGVTGLMQEKALESSVALNAACKRLETELAGRSFDVNVRLANVLGRRIDTAENPLVPAVMTRILWQSVTQYCESRRVHASLHKILVKRVIPLLAEIYDQLDATLDQQGVRSSYWTGDGKGPPGR